MPRSRVRQNTLGSAPGDQSAEESQQAFDTTRLPIDTRTGRAIVPGPQPGYYPGYDVLSQRAFWDGATRHVVMERVESPPPIRFFSDPAQLALVTAVFDRLLPQDDRDEQHRVPIVNYVDEKLFLRKIPGYRFENMPPEQEVYRLGLNGIEEIARHLYARSFVELDPLGQDRVLVTLHDGNPPAGHEYWGKVHVRHFWMLILEHACDAYYAHPYAWNEIGFGGPAYPRGYMRLDLGMPEPWEEEEQRYPWAAPPTALSGAFQPISGKRPLDEQLHEHVPSPSSGGTH